MSGWSSRPGSYRPSFEEPQEPAWKRIARGLAIGFAAGFFICAALALAARAWL